MSAATRLARTHSVSLVGLEGRLVRVETQVGRGLVQFVIVGLPDASVRESKDRVRSALESCGLEVLDSRVTVNLSPAGLHKSGSGFDLAIAASVLLAAGRVGPTSFDGAVIIGELALDGSLQPVRGVLPAVLAARGRGITRAIIPAANAAEASLVGGVETAAFAHLAELVRWAGGNAQTPVSIGGALPNAPEPEPATSGPHVDMADVRGQHDAVEALTVAGAGGHHVFLLGEPGSGKTMLASRMHTILPDLDDDTALVATSLHSLAGTLRDGEALVRRPPILTPHHSATMAALVGGGHARITPGAASLAHGGVLFLDEAAQFQPSVLDALREPLENGEVHIHRAGLHARLPARFQLLLAANPCPCGGGRQGRSCTCSAQARMRYLARLSGPLLDRIDITVRVDTPTRADLARGPSPSSAHLRERVAEALESGDAGVGRGSRRGLARVLALLTVTGAVVALAAPTVPRERTVLRDLFEPPLDLTQYATPLSLVRTLETDLASTTLMTASGADDSTRIRLAALDSYDGLSARIGTPTSGAARFQRVGRDTPLAASGGTRSEFSHETSVRIDGYTFPWVPTVSDSLGLEVSGPRADAVSQSLYYDAFSATGIATAGLTDGDVLTEQVDAPPTASDTRLTELGVDDVALGPVEDVPPSVQTLATTLVGSTSEPLAQIRILQQALRTGYYSDGTKSPSQPGHGAARLTAMVEAGALVGDDEQYPVLMMLMCRSLGIPARVVMGFEPAMDGDASNVTGQDVSAWVEVPFRSVGWVTIDVVPDRDQVPQQQTTEKVSNPEPQVLQPPLPLQDPAHLPPSYEDEDRDSSNDDDGRGLGRIVAMVAGGLGAMLLPIATILATKALRRRRRRRRGGVEGVLGAWDEVVDRARDFGRRTPPRATRREAALSLAPAFPTAELTRFAAAVDGQVFGKGIPTSYAVSTIWASADAMVPSMGSDRSRMRRLAARLSPRSLGRPHRTGSRAARRPITRSRPRRKRS